LIKAEPCLNGLRMHPGGYQEARMRVAQVENPDSRQAGRREVPFERAVEVVGIDWPIGSRRSKHVVVVGIISGRMREQGLDGRRR
jgi:hypothetical protein